MEEGISCCECGDVFPSRRSLHAHIKSHSMILAEYYVKNFPKFDLYSGEPLPFKNYDTYISTDFRTKKNMYKFLNSASEQERKLYCNQKLRKHLSDGRNYKFAPNYLYLLTHPRMPKIEYFEDADISEICSELGMERVFTKKLASAPNLSDIPKNIRIFEDTREQQPLVFDGIESVKMKLDFGDYTAVGNDYLYIYVDRKAESDFQGTMTSGFERFCRELDRVRHFSSYLFIVVESNFQKMYCKKPTHKVNMTYVLENMRKIITNYSDICQFVFTGSRESSSLIVPYLLSKGELLKTVDVQREIEEQKWLG